MAIEHASLPHRSDATSAKASQALRLLHGQPRGSSVRFDASGNPILIRAGYYKSRDGKSFPASSRPTPLPPLGFVVLCGAGDISGNASVRLRPLEAEYAAAGAFDESVRAIQRDERRFALKWHHDGGEIADTRSGKLSISIGSGVPTAVWYPDASDIEHRALVARARAGNLTCSAEFIIERSTDTGVVRRLDKVDLRAVSLLRTNETPAYAACLVGVLDPLDIPGSLFRLRGRALLRAKGVL